MYRKLRNIHFSVAMFLFPFLLAFAISAVDLAHRKWFPHPRHTIEENRIFQPGITDARILARNWRGELAKVENRPGYLHFRVGGSHEITYSIETGETQVRTTSFSLLAALTRIHLSQGTWAYVAMIFSFGLLTLGATGLYLWFKNQQERTIGSVLLILGAAMALALVTSMRAS